MYKSVTSKSYSTQILSGIVIVGLFASYFFVPEIRQFFDNAWEILTSDDEKRIREWVDGFGWFGPLLIVLAMVVQMFLFVIPSLLLMVVAILAFGPLWGSIIILIAIFAASSVGYFLGWKFGQTIVFKLIGAKTEKKLEEFIEDYRFWAVIITRLNPFLSNDAISFVAGILTMGYWRFIGATFIGILPLTLLVAIFGENIESLKTGLLWSSLAILLVTILYFWWKKHHTSKD